MEKYKLKDTICAPATSLIRSAIGIVRVSGINAEKIKDKIFFPKYGEQNPFIATRGNIISNIDNNIIDEVICIYYPNNKSYTGEKLVEFFLHGSPFLITELIKLLLKNNCRSAEPGEFTFRAFISGKMNLCEIESIDDLINTNSKMIANNSIKILQGDLSKILYEIKNIILYSLSFIERSINFEEQLISSLNINKILIVISKSIILLKKIVKKSKVMSILNEKIKILIIGPSNVGKSTLINTLISNNKSIVHHQPGTTRDLIEIEWEINDFKITLIDSAGIRDKKHIINDVELIGIERTIAKIKDVNLVLLLLDANSKEFKYYDFKNFILRNKIKYLIVKTKSDLLKQNVNCKDSILISAKYCIGIEKLKSEILNKILPDIINDVDNQIFVIKKRQIDIIKKIIKYLNTTKNLLIAKSDLEILSYFLHKSDLEINKLLGISTDENFLDNIFSKFCIGK